METKQPVKLDQKEAPEMLVIELSTAERIMLPELQHPETMDMMATVLFDDDKVSETFGHLRQSCKPVRAEYLFDSYTCKFRQKIIVPCVGKKRFLLYISCIINRMDENGKRRVDVTGYGYTKPIELETCMELNNYKHPLCSADGTRLLEMRLSYTVKASKNDGSEVIPEDRMGGILDLYKA
ncbi:hypothetical protein BBOV_II000160 [Babesia bovis T2Bo]|uniref:hypothetical protein n=1 Tax=Babesia bovis T2Bo TaxID=484906 RepID=UPI001C349DA9|nr:hypothetical protein BBOV_II000160 [Babesia bovis T2Bo]EDO05977.2 hypothetical protein BBOV_II000160 [Babesia bovis T2Bo]